MSNILQAKVEVVGIKPFLFHAFGREAIPLQKGERTGVAGNDPEECDHLRNLDREIETSFVE